MDHYSTLVADRQHRYGGRRPRPAGSTRRSRTSLSCDRRVDGSQWARSVVLVRGAFRRRPSTTIAPSVSRGVLTPGGAPCPRRRRLRGRVPGRSALATECYVNLWRAAELLVGLHNRHTLEQYQLSPSARDVLAVVEGAGQPLEPSVIAERLVVTTGSMTSLLDNLEKRGLVRRLPHPDDRRKLLIDITPDARAIVDELLPALHAREREVIGAALSASEQRTLLRYLAKLQRAATDAQSTPMPRAPRRRRSLATDRPPERKPS